MELTETNIRIMLEEIRSLEEWLDRSREDIEFTLKTKGFFRLPIRALSKDTYIKTVSAWFSVRNLQVNFEEIYGRVYVRKKEKSCIIV